MKKTLLSVVFAFILISTFSFAIVSPVKACIADTSGKTNCTNEDINTKKLSLIQVLTQLLQQLQTQLQTLLAQQGNGNVSINQLIVDVRANGQEDSVSIQNGQTANISWTSTGASNCTLNSNPADSSLAGSWASKLQTSGSLPLSPSANTTYTITCYNSGVSRSGSVNVDVGSAQNQNSKTYTNTQYGFSFKYPSDWTVKDASVTDNKGIKYPAVNIYSPYRTGLQGYANDSVQYRILIMTDGGDHSKIVPIADFGDDMSRQSAWNLDPTKYKKENTDEYKIGQQIISSFKFIDTTSIQNQNKQININAGPLGQHSDGKFYGNDDIGVSWYSNYKTNIPEIFLVNSNGEKIYSKKLVQGAMGSSAKFGEHLAANQNWPTGSYRIGICDYENALESACAYTSYFNITSTTTPFQP